MAVDSTQKLKQGSSDFGYAIQVRQFAIDADVLPTLGGKDLGPNPHEILEASLAA